MKPNFLLANEIRKLRMTQAELVRLAGISSEARMSRIINGYEVPRSEEVKSICSILQRTPDQLGLGGKNETRD